MIRATLAGLLLLSVLVGPTSTALAQCADPRGNAYCTNNGQVTTQNPTGGQVNTQNPTGGQVNTQNPTGGQVNTQNPTGGQVTFNPPPSAPVNAPPAQPQPPQSPSTTAPSGPAPAAGNQGFANGALSVDPSAAAAGETVTVTVTGLPAGTGFVVNLGQLKTLTGNDAPAKNMQSADGARLNVGPDGSFTGSFVVPTVPDQVAPQASVCAAVLGRASYCVPFSLSSAGLPPENNATADNIVGHYMCSSMLRVGRGSTFCSGGEAILALNADGTYVWGEEAGSYKFDSDSFVIAFSGGLGDGSILNRRLVASAVVDGQEIRYTYIRMDY